MFWVAANGRLEEFRGVHELALAADHFDLLLAVNLPDVRGVPLNGAAREFGQLLREQQPVAGMFGETNRTLVRQFRMPGYPFVLITTDLLQEGEDLHTFCSSVRLAFTLGVAAVAAALGTFALADIVDRRRFPPRHPGMDVRLGGRARSSGWPGSRRPRCCWS